MHKRRFRAPSPALVISLLALFVALGGTTYAATILPKNSVGTKQLKNNAVTGAKIRNATVTATKINTTGLTVPNAIHATGAETAVDATNATNATTLGGYLPNDLLRAASGTTSVNDGDSGSPVPVTATIITGVNAPKAGGLLIQVTLSCDSVFGTTDTRWDWSAQVDGMSQGTNQVLLFPHAEVPTPGSSGSTSVFVPVTAGTHTVGYTASPTSGDGSLDCNISASSLFVAFTNTGSALAHGVQSRDATVGANRQP